MQTLKKKDKENGDEITSLCTHHYSDKMNSQLGRAISPNQLSKREEGE